MTHLDKGKYRWPFHALDLQVYLRDHSARQESFNESD